MVIQIRNEGGDGALEIDIVFPQRIACKTAHLLRNTRVLCCSALQKRISANRERCCKETLTRIPEVIRQGVAKLRALFPKAPKPEIYLRYGSIAGCLFAGPRRCSFVS